jgi:hypothetical protein
MSPQPLVQFPQYPQKRMSVEKSHHQNGNDGHERGNNPDQSDALSFLFGVCGHFLGGDVNYKLREARPRIRVAPAAGRESSFLIFQGNALVCPVTVRAECALIVSEIYGGLSVKIFQIGGFLGKVAGATNLRQISARFQS